MREVDPVSGAEVVAEFRYAFAYGVDVADRFAGEVALADAVLAVLELVGPFVEFVGRSYLHVLYCILEATLCQAGRVLEPIANARTSLILNSR